VAEALTADIEDLMRESAAALERRDLVWVEEHTSRAEGTVAIGTDPDEYAPRLRHDHAAHEGLDAGRRAADPDRDR